MTLKSSSKIFSQGSEFSLVFILQLLLFFVHFSLASTYTRWCTRQKLDYTQIVHWFISLSQDFNEGNSRNSSWGICLSRVLPSRVSVWIWGGVFCIFFLILGMKNVSVCKHPLVLTQWADGCEDMHGVPYGAGPTPLCFHNSQSSVLCRASDCVSFLFFVLSECHHSDSICLIHTWNCKFLFGISPPPLAHLVLEGRKIVGSL